ALVDGHPRPADDEVAVVLVAGDPVAGEGARHRLGALALGVDERPVEVEEDRPDGHGCPLLRTVVTPAPVWDTDPACAPSPPCCASSSPPAAPRPRRARPSPSSTSATTPAPPSSPPASWRSTPRTATCGASASAPPSGRTTRAPRSS